MSDRATARLAFAQQALSQSLSIEAASADASFRSYWRVRDAHGASAIVMDAPPQLEDCTPFIDIGQRLQRADLIVPTPMAADLTQGFLLLPDFGTRTLLPELDALNVEQHYEHALASLLQMQTATDCLGMAPYDAPRLNAEMELFPTWFLQRHLGLEVSCEDFDVIEAAMTILRNQALEQPKVFVHRDFHSRNLMLIGQANSPAHRHLALLDFQDALHGPITYDLVSLLRDCYIAWPLEQVQGWVERYRRLSADAGLHKADAALFQRWFDWMGVQRHLKVLGIFARLNYRDGKPGYLADLPLVLHYTVSVCAHYPELAAFGQWLEQHTAGRDLRQIRAV